MKTMTYNNDLPLFFNEVPAVYAGQPVSQTKNPLEDFTSKPVQWSSSDGSTFIPTSNTTATLPPGYYEICSSMEVGLYFQKININLDNIIIFPDAVTNKVVTEISDFWNKEKRFEEFNLSYKRGILLQGCAGGGKSTTLQLVSKDVINRDGIILKFTAPELFSLGLRKIRAIQPDVPIVVLMEDLDAIINNYNESAVINILDGVDRLHKIVFLATTNFPERLEDRVLNRPSRFDKIYKIGFLSAESREIYFKSLIGEKDVTIDMDSWVKDTENLSIAHLKELFISVVIFEDDYEESLERLKSMKIKPSSEDDRFRIGLRSE